MTTPKENMEGLLTVLPILIFQDKSEIHFCDELNSYRDAGISRVIINRKYETADDWSRDFEVLDKVLPRF